MQAGSRQLEDSDTRDGEQRAELDSGESTTDALDLIRQGFSGRRVVFVWR